MSESEPEQPNNVASDNVENVILGLHESSDVTDDTLFDSNLEEQRTRSERRRATIEGLMIFDDRSRIVGRLIIAALLLILLGCQNWQLFHLVWFYATNNQVVPQGALSVIVGGTLAETGYVVRVIVQWLFSDINYEKHNK